MDNLTEPYCYIDDLYQSFKPEFETQIIASGRRRLRACQINVAEITAFLV
ncbi:IS982 family transposase, partial [Psychrobacter sp. AOP7-D2-23]